MLLNVSLRRSDQMFVLGKGITKKLIQRGVAGDITHFTGHLDMIKTIKSSK